jgi:DNA-binding transcriptional ArsR family regulator
MRIILALAGSGPATAGELAERIPDVPTATLYRHVNALRAGGVLAVAGERKVRGATERRFALHPGAASLGPADLAAATREDHLRWFATYLAGLLGAFGRYVDRGVPDLARDGVGYREIVLQLSDEELGRFAADLNAAIVPYVTQPPAAGRTPRLFATVLMPADPAGDPAGGPPDQPNPPTTEAPARP